jgi:hypothetical protein
MALYYKINPSTQVYIDAGKIMSGIINEMADDTGVQADYINHVKYGDVDTYIRMNEGLDAALSIVSLASSILSVANAIVACQMALALNYAGFT